MHVRFICAMKFYLLTYLLTYLQWDLHKRYVSYAFVSTYVLLRLYFVSPVLFIAFISIMFVNVCQNVCQIFDWRILLLTYCYLINKYCRFSSYKHATDRQTDRQTDGQIAALLSNLISWRRGVVVSGVRRMNEVNARRARLVPGWVTIFGRVYHLGT